MKEVKLRMDQDWVESRGKEDVKALRERKRVTVQDYM